MSNEEVEQSAKKKSSFPWKNTGIVILIILVLGLVYLSYAAYTQYKILNQQWLQLTAETQNKTMQLQRELAFMQKNVYVSTQMINQDILGIKQKLTQVAQLQTNAKIPLALAEARFDAKLAMQALEFQNNIPKAITLLKLADDEIRSLSDPKYDVIRKALTDDVAHLQGIPLVDITGIYMQLSALNAKVDQLPLMNKPSSVNAEHANVVQDKNPSWWRRGLETSWQTLQQMVVIRYNRTGTPSLIPPDQQPYFYQNLHALFMQAEWALLHTQETIYRTSLGEIIAWIKEYGVMDSSLTQATLNNLAELQKINIHPEVPTISNSLKALEEMNA